MNMTKLTAHIYETRTGELRMIVTDDKGNQAIAPVVPTESLLTTVTCSALAFTLKNPDDLTRLITTIRESKNDGREFCRVVVVGCEVFKVR